MVTVKVFVSVAVPYLAMALSVTVTASLPAAGRLTVTVRDLSFTPSPSVAISLPPVTSHEMVEPLLPLVGTEKLLRMSSESSMVTTSRSALACSASESCFGTRTV